MKKKGLVILLLPIFILTFMGNCGFGKFLEKKSELTLRSLKIHGEKVAKSELVIYKDITQITSENVNAFFSYDSVEEPVEIQVEVKNSPVLLYKDVPTTVELYVPSGSNEYRSWSKSITVIVK